MVSHHLTDEILDGMMRDCSRVLKDDGYFVFLDWLRPDQRIPSRVLCALDRGANPRFADHLTRLVAPYFEIGRSDRFTVLQEYLVMVLGKQPAPAKNC